MLVDRYGKRLVVTPSTPQERRITLALAGAAPQQDGSHVTFPLEPLVIRDLQQEFGEIQMTNDAASWFQTVLAHARQAVRLAGEKDALLDNLNVVSLYPYQRVGANWLVNVKRGILGDEMGLGKTIQSLMATMESWRVLVITVNMAKRSVWERHLVDWVLRPVMVADGERKNRQEVVHNFAYYNQPGYLVINHEMLRGKVYDELFHINWDCVIVDEAHKLQDMHSQQSEGARRLKAERLYLLTGTPVWNRPESIWHLLHLLDPARWSSFWTFVDEYCEVAQTPWAKEIVGTKPWMVERLQSVLSTVMLRRTKTEVLPQLPKKTVQRLDYDLAPEVSRTYKTLKKKLKLLDEQGAVAKVEASAMAAFADLRRLCNAPTLLGLPFPSAKDAVIDELLDEALSEAGQRKVIVFVWHKDYANYLFERLKGRGAVLITGDTRHREEAVDFFRTTPTARILIATIGAAGISIDLIEANVAIFAEGSHVPTLDTQAEDRLHRIGQQTDVTIYRLAARRTVETALWNVVEDRQGMANEMMAFREVVARTLAEEDD